MDSVDAAPPGISLLPPLHLLGSMDLADFDGFGLGFGEGDAFGDENDQENGPPAVANAAARADSSGESSGSDENEPLEERKERKKMGRPPLPDLPLDEPPKGECVLSLGVLISRVMVAMSRGNVATRTQQSVWDAFRGGFSCLPSFGHAKILLARQASLQSKEHACCPNDCYVQRVSLGEIKENLLLPKTICPTCKTKLTNKRGQAVKVRHISTNVGSTQRLQMCSVYKCADSVLTFHSVFCLLVVLVLVVEVPLHRHRTTTAETS